MRNRLSPLSRLGKQFAFRVASQKVAVVLGVLTLIIGVVSVPALWAAASPSLLQSATFTLDNVTATIQTPFLPSTTFGASQPGDASQVATSWTLHPYGEVSVTAVPFGTTPGTEALPIARAGAAGSYRSSLHASRSSSARSTRAAPAISMFGTRVPGEANLLDLHLYSTTLQPTVVIEWVAEAGSRLWVLRVSKELPPGTTDLGSAAPFLNSLAALSLSSSSLDHPSSLAAHGDGNRPAPTPNTCLSTCGGGGGSYGLPTSLPAPSWWNGSQCDNAKYSGPIVWDSQGGYSTGGAGTAAYPLSSGAYYRGLVACGPRPAFDGVPDVLTNGFPGTQQFEWECAELSKRYLDLEFGQPAYPANGSEIVWNYPGTQLAKVGNGTVGEAPQPGDVLSYGSTSTAGHTSIVIASNVDSNGNGTISVLEENGSSSGLPPAISVSNWQVNPGWTTVSGWLTPWLGESPRRLASGDFNRDGRDDVLGLYSYGDARTGAWYFSGPALNSPSEVWDSGSGNWEGSQSKMVVGDFNGDGIPDMTVFYNYGNGDTGAWFFQGTPSGGLSSPMKVWDSGAGNWDWNRSKFVAGDVTGDGKADVICYYNYGGADTRAWLFAGTSPGLSAPITLWNSGGGNWDWEAWG